MSNGNTAGGRQAGFTLIELSIVLVIIGLIIGGILKGQEMIRSTQLKTTVSQWDATKAAVNTFQDKYLALPGDYERAGDTSGGLPGKIEASLTNGDGDGVIGASTALDAALNVESSLAWAHLRAANLISGIQDSDPANDKYRLPTKLSGGGMFVFYNDGTNINGYSGHFLRLQAAADYDNTSPGVLLSPKQASEVDRKWDDDLATSGTIQAWQGSDTDCFTASTGEYVLDDAAQCIVALQVQ